MNSEKPTTEPASVQYGLASRIQDRVLQRISGQISNTICAEDYVEDYAADLLAEMLEQADATYGCALRQLASDTSPGASRCIRNLSLEAVTTLNEAGEFVCIDDQLPNAPLDSFTVRVLTASEPVYSNNLLRGIPAILPRRHPPLKNFAMLPLRGNGTNAALLLLANAARGFNHDMIDRLQSMLDTVSGTDFIDRVQSELQQVLVHAKYHAREHALLLASSLNGIITIDKNDIITSFNPACENIFGIPASLAVRRPLNVFLPESTLQTIVGEREKLIGSQSLQNPLSYRYRGVAGIRHNGDSVCLDIVVYHTRLAARVDTTLIVNDVGKQLASAKELQHAQTRLESFLGLAPVGIIELGTNWTCTHANDTWYRLSKLDLEASLDTGWIDAIHSDDVAHTLIHMRKALRAGEVYRQELRLQPAEQGTRWVSMSATGLYDENDNPSGALIVFLDSNEQHIAGEKLRQVNKQDKLTGLLNRGHFLELLESDLRQCDIRCRVALLYIDLDDFKQVNETYGHLLGDELLRQVANRLRSTVREEDRIARLGGDEFIVTLTHLPSGRSASVVAEKILHQIRLPFTVHAQQVCVSASIGIATGDHSSESHDVIIKQADMALHSAKESGRSRFVFYTPTLDHVRRAHSLLVGSIRYAVDHRNFELHYQPQLLVDGQSLFGFEALLRWPHQSGPAVATDTVIAVMESSGLINEVGQWVIKEACEQYMKWFDAGLFPSGTTMSVNVSASQLGMPHFVRHVDAILKRYNMLPSHLVLEITESTLVQTLESDVLHKIKSLGVQISLDDFGTGYSSLAYLSQLPLDHLKVDRSFITNITHSRRAVAVVKGIIALARTLGIKVIAEGVEDAAVLPLLQAEGCAAYQGYHVSRAIPGDSVPALLSALSHRDPAENNIFIDLGEPDSVQGIA